MWKCMIVLCVGLMTHGKCRVDRPFLYHMTRCRVKTSPPFPAMDRHWTAYLILTFGLNPQTPKRCHMDLWLARLVLTHLHLHGLHPFLLQQLPMEPRVSVFLYRVASLAGCFLPFFVLHKELPLALFFLQQTCWDAIFAIMELDWLALL